MINQHKKNHGFSLIELMITLVLSLLVTYAIAQLLINSNRTSVTSDGISQSQETGRFVMSYLANQVRQAGLDSITDNTKFTQAIISCSAPDFVGLTSTTGEVACSTNTNTGDTQATIYNAGIHGDRLAIAWIPPLPASGNAADIRDCSGVGGYNENDTILNVFWVESDGNGMNNLVCQGSTLSGGVITRSNPKQAVANGVDSMQVLFGEATEPLPISNQRNINKYVNIADVNNWERVYAIKIAILTRSISEVTNSNILRRYVLLDAEPYLMTDSINRQVFSTTYVINNYK